MIGDDLLDLRTAELLRHCGDLFGRYLADSAERSIEGDAVRSDASRDRIRLGVACRRIGGEEVLQGRDEACPQRVIRRLHAPWSWRSPFFDEDRGDDAR